MTSRCNLRCQMCPLTSRATLSSEYIAAMPEAVWERVVEAGRAAGQAIISGYGEPLLDPDWLSRLRALDEAGINIGMTTNGTLVTAERAAALASLKHLFHVNVSIDSPDAVEYRAIRGGELKLALRGLGYLATAAPRPDWLAVSSVLMERNVASLAQLPGILASLGVRVYNPQMLIDLNLEVRDQHLFLHPDMAAGYEAIRQACVAAGVELRPLNAERLLLEVAEAGEAQAAYHIRTPAQEQWTRQCVIPWEFPFVNKDGLVFPCCYASTDATAVVGDLGRQSFADVWQGDDLQRFRLALLDGKTTPPICQGCAAAPWGEHPLSTYSASLLLERSRLTDPDYMELVVENTGRAVWTRDVPLRLGTAAPRDHPSPWQHRDWLNDRRVATFQEDEVAPGQTATFRFRIAQPRDFPMLVERFQLVVEEVCWLPGTRLEVAMPERRGRRLVHFLARTLDRVEAALRRLSGRRQGSGLE